MLATVVGRDGGGRALRRAAAGVDHGPTDAGSQEADGAPAEEIPVRPNALPVVPGVGCGPKVGPGDDVPALKSERPPG